MARWKYTIDGGTALREAIYDDNIDQTVECLLKCFEELNSKLSEEDNDWKRFDIEDCIDVLKLYDSSSDDEDDINYYLQEFYNICDDVRAFVAL